jgi:hypothetical protein
MQSTQNTIQRIHRICFVILTLIRSLDNWMPNIRLDKARASALLTMSEQWLLQIKLITFHVLRGLLLMQIGINSNIC